ncbi:MAG: MFS transporter [Burkholderiaceae bacterium]
MKKILAVVSSSKGNAMPASRRGAALCAVCLGSFLATLDISIVNVALPTMLTALRTDVAGLQWVVNAYAICLSAFMLSAGPTADRYGHKRAWLGGVLLFTVGSALCGEASSLSVLLAGRAIQGAAAAFLIAGAMPILTHAFPDPKARTYVIGAWSAFNALALILGPLCGGILLRHLGWQSIFSVNLPLGLVAFVLGGYGITEHRYPVHAARNPAGLVLSVLSLGAMTFGMIEAGERGWFDVLPLAATALAVLGFMLFFAAERRASRPLLPLVLLREPAFFVANAASFTLGFSYYSSLFFFSIFLQQIQGWSPIEAGWRMMPQFVTTLCISTLFGRLSRVIRLQWLTAVGYGLAGLAFLLLTTCSASTPYWIIGLLFALLGGGAGLAVPATSITVMGMAPTELSGAASATMNALRQAGMTIGIALLGTLMSERAIRIFSFAANERGMADAPAVAREAIAHHKFPNSSAGLQSLFIQAMEGGFHLAMLLAGGACLVSFGLLLAVRTDAMFLHGSKRMCARFRIDQ